MGHICEFIFFLLLQSGSKDQVCQWGGCSFTPWSMTERPPLPSPILLCFSIGCQVRVVVLEKCCAREDWGRQGTDMVVDDRDNQLLKHLTTVSQQRPQYALFIERLWNLICWVFVETYICIMVPYLMYEDATYICPVFNICVEIPISNYMARLVRRGSRRTWY